MLLKKSLDSLRLFIATRVIELRVSIYEVITFAISSLWLYRLCTLSLGSTIPVSVVRVLIM